MSLFLPNSRAFGLEINPHALRLADVSKDYFGFHIHSVNEIPLDQNHWLKNGLKDKEGLAKKIRQGLETAQPHPITKTKAIFSIPESAVFTKVLQLPKLALKELHQTVPYEAAEFLPLPLEEVYLDWQIDPDLVTIDDKSICHVLVVATPKSLIDDLIDLAAKAELQLIAIESEPFATCRSLTHLLRRDQVSVVLTIDQRQTTLVLATNQVIKFSSTILIGSEKLSHKLASAGAMLSDEITEAISYYQNRLGERQAVVQIILSGAGGQIKQLRSTIEKQTKIPTFIGHSPIKLPDKTRVHSRFNTVIGLSLRKKT